MDQNLIVREMLLAIGENPDRIGLIDTPKRVTKMWKELFYGYDEFKKPIVTTFPNNEDGLVYDQMITDTGHGFSMCEHHLMPFEFTYIFGYIPNDKVLGLSKVARVVDYFAGKLQVQERLTKEIVDYLDEILEPQGIGLVLNGRHLCKSMRGVKKEGNMNTSVLRGSFRDEPETRAEFLQLTQCG